MIVWIITRRDRDDQWSPATDERVIEAVTGTDPAAVESDAAARLAELEAGAPDNSGHPANDLTTYHAERVWIVNRDLQG